MLKWLKRFLNLTYLKLIKFFISFVVYFKGCCGDFIWLRLKGFCYGIGNIVCREMVRFFASPVVLNKCFYKRLIEQTLKFITFLIRLKLFFVSFFSNVAWYMRGLLQKPVLRLLKFIRRFIIIYESLYDSYYRITYNMSVSFNKLFLFNLDLKGFLSTLVFGCKFKFFFVKETLRSLVTLYLFKIRHLGGKFILFLKKCYDYIFRR